MSDEKSLIEHLIASSKTLATAESCTGGLIGKLLTDVSGSSAAYLGGIISYSNEVKHRVLGVPQELLDIYGAVSAQVAKAMAEGARRVIGSDLAVSVTGIAGPKSDSTNKPVGLVYIGVTDGTTTEVREYRFSGDRETVRSTTAQTALRNVALFLERQEKS